MAILKSTIKNIRDTHWVRIVDLNSPYYERIGNKIYEHEFVQMGTWVQFAGGFEVCFDKDAVEDVVVRANYQGCGINDTVYISGGSDSIFGTIGRVARLNYCNGGILCRTSDDEQHCVNGWITVSVYPASKEWIGVDFDGTLVEDTGWVKGGGHIGKPINKMISRVRRWLEQGERVKIFTARANPLIDTEEEPYKQRIEAVQRWVWDTFKMDLEIVCEKDLYMTILWDDRVRQLVPNTGEPATPEKKEGPVEVFLGEGKVLMVTIERDGLTGVAFKKKDQAGTIGPASEEDSEEEIVDFDFIVWFPTAEAGRAGRGG